MAGHLGRRTWAFLSLSLVIGLVGCTIGPAQPRLSFDILEKTAQPVMARLQAAWAAPRGMVIVLTRDLGAEFEQKIGLSNTTTLDGDNFLWLRARIPGGYPVGNFRLVDFVNRVGEVPTPFTTITDADLRSENDALGTYFYLVHRTGGETNCVLAFRRIDGALRQMPRGTSVLEVMLRNCVSGTVAEALAPITDLQIAYGATGGPIPEGGGRMISPLAGPLVD